MPVRENITVYVFNPHPVKFELISVETEMTTNDGKKKFSSYCGKCIGSWCCEQYIQVSDDTPGTRLCC